MYAFDNVNNSGRSLTQREYSVFVTCVESEASIGCSVRSQPFSLAHKCSPAGNVSGLLDREFH